MQHQCSDGIVHDWMPRSENPKVCPRCKGSLDKPQTVKPAHPPCLDFIPKRGTIPLVKWKRARTIYDTIRRNYYFNFIPKREVKQEVRRRKLVTPYDSIRKSYYFNFIPMRKITKYKRKRPLTMNDCKQQIRYAFVEEKKKRSREKNKQTLAVFDNMISKNTSCKKIIESHKFILDGDPERLTTDFLVDITGCNCLRRR